MSVYWRSHTLNWYTNCFQNATNILVVYSVYFSRSFAVSLTFQQYTQNAYKATMSCCQFDQVLSLGFAYVHNLEISLRVLTEEQIVTVCVFKFIRVLFWNSLWPQLDCCVLRKKCPPTNLWFFNITSNKRHDNKNIYNASYTHDFITASCREDVLCVRLQIFQLSQLQTTAIKGWRRCQSRRLKASSYQPLWQERF